MINGERVLAVIPARGGSKGLPGKNIRDFCGRPLLAWSVLQGLACNYIDTVLVSTDSQETADIALAHGARVPFLRPVTLAGDAASSIDVLLHALDFLSNAAEHYKYVVLLEPTSPLRDVADIAGALELLHRDPQAKSVVGVTKAEASHPSFLFAVREGFLCPAFGSQPTGLRRQDLKDDFFYLEGSIYASSEVALRENRSFYHSATVPWVVDRYKAIEIDELSDFIAAEALMKAKIEGVIL